MVLNNKGGTKEEKRSTERKWEPIKIRTITRLEGGNCVKRRGSWAGGREKEERSRGEGGVGGGEREGVEEAYHDRRR